MTITSRPLLPSLLSRIGVAAAAGLALTASACGFDPEAPSEELANRLRRRVFLDVATTSDVDVSATARSGEPLDVDPTVLGGQAVVRTTEDGWLLLEDLDIALEDVTVPAGTLSPDKPVTFTDLSLRLGTQLSIAPVGGTEKVITGWGEADLLLDWAMVSWHGDVLPLAMRKIEDAPFAVAIELGDDGQIRGAISARVNGVVDTLGELVVLRDLGLDVQSAEGSVAAR
ncbi:MAG TPA: hypothetical protein VM513_09295 [Kofleriaceae bacterium]|nr:hypothetical protein [Kofleriaceae bacterium]